MATTDLNKKEFWESRGKHGTNPGSNDFVLKKLEIQEILKHVQPNSKVLDAGCGDGETLVTLSDQKFCKCVGIDFSEAMVTAAQTRASKSQTPTNLKFYTGALPKLQIDEQGFDYVITERSLINLANIEEQKEAFETLMSLLKPGGYYLMVESFTQGLERSNSLRKTLDLPPIDPPWHNRFLDEEVVASWENKQNILKTRVTFTSTYHLISRVLYARLATNAGEEMRYDSDLNLMSLKLPIIGNFGPVQLFMWQKTI